MNTLKTMILGKLKLKLCLVFLLCSVLLLQYVRSVEAGRDRTAPEIRVPDRELEYTPGEDEDRLLRSVKAEDDVDGDVTNTVRVRDIYVLNDLETAVVTYVAKDNSQNVGVAQRQIRIERSSEEDEEKEEEDGSDSDENTESDENQQYGDGTGDNNDDSYGTGY